MDAGRLENLLEDLFSLEVNTILKPGMTATKMPNAAHALIDVARDYALELNGIAKTLGEEQRELPEGVLGEKPGTDSTFHELRERAALLARVLQGLPRDAKAAAFASPRELTAAEGAQLLMLCRIRDTSDQLKGLVPKGLEFGRNSADDTALSLSDNQRLVLRKAWEVGVEQVVMQTVVYLDGDVVTRIRPDCLSAEHRPLLEVHRQSVDTSISFWRGLVDVVRALFGGASGSKSG